MNNEYLGQIIEACFLTAASPVSVSQLKSILDNQIDYAEIEQIISTLQHKYLNSGVELVLMSGGYRFRSRVEFQPYLNKLFQIKPPKYSRAIMETLAIIVYKQPVTRGEIEDIRGVSLNAAVIQTLMERGWIEVVGQKQVPGKPELLASTSKFLQDLGLTSISQLPQLPETQLPGAYTSADLMEEHDEQKQ